MPTKKEQEIIDQMDHSRGAATAVADQSEDGMIADPPEPGDPVAPPDPGDEDEAQQLRYLADAPQWALVPPSGAEFANATWLEAKRDVHALVHEVLLFPEFAELASMSIEVRWRRHSKPTYSTKGSPPRFVTVVTVDPRMIWEAEKHGCENFPRVLIDLHWQHYIDRRKVEPFYVHGDEVKRDLHHSLMGLAVQNEGIRTRSVDVSAYSETVRRFGLTDSTLREFASAARLWPAEEAE